MGQQLNISKQTTFPEADTFLLKYYEQLQLQFIKNLSKKSIKN